MARRRMWDLEDLASVGDLAKEYGVCRAALANWTTRYDTFPAPLTKISGGRVYSRVQVRKWYGTHWTRLRADQKHTPPQ